MMLHWSFNRQRLCLQNFEESYHVRFYPHIEVDIEKKNRQKQNEEARWITIPYHRENKNRPA